MDLSPEDSLRLNVMLANAVAVRIDEGSLTVYGLSGEGNEAKVKLNPTTRSDKYVRAVRELLSSTVLGSPGGYPVFLKRWTRMGQQGDARLADLLMLGEPEAVVAVSGAKGLSDDLAKRAWWCMPCSDNARSMLQREQVVSGEMGRVLADFLVEFLPFEEEPRAIIESVKLILQPGLIDEQVRQSIWQRGKAKNVFRVGFLLATPDDLPDTQPDRADLSDHQAPLSELAGQGNPFAQLLLKLFRSPGQSFLAACRDVLKKPANQDVVVALMEAIEAYFAAARLNDKLYRTVEEITQDLHTLLAGEQSEMQSNHHLDILRDRLPDLAKEIEALLFLAHVGEPIVRPIFAITDSVGSVMRRKLEPVSLPLFERMACLLPG